MQEITCCFSGHREIPRERLPRLQAALDEAVAEAAQAGFRLFISGGARGFDLLAAEAVLRAKAQGADIRLLMALPCPQQDKGWPQADRARYAALLRAADETVCLSPRYTQGCMLLRDRYMVERSARCICYMEGFRGGTGYTVKYALRQGAEVINLALKIL